MCGGGRGGIGFYWRPPFLLTLGLIISLMNLVMISSAIGVDRMMVSTFNGGIERGTGYLQVGILEYCFGSDDGLFSDKCFDRSELRLRCSVIYDEADSRLTQCNDFVDGTWTLLVTAGFAAVLNLVCLTMCAMGISCLIPHISAVNNTAIALSICSLFAFVLLCVTLAVHNSTERDFWSGLRDDFIEERTDVPPGEIVWRTFRRARCYNLLAASVVFQLIFSLFAVTFRRKRYFHAHPRYRGRFVGYGRRGFYI